MFDIRSTNNNQISGEIDKASFSLSQYCSVSEQQGIIHSIGVLSRYEMENRLVSVCGSVSAQRVFCGPEYFSTEAMVTALTFSYRLPQWLFTIAASGGLKVFPANRLHGVYPYLLYSLVAHYPFEEREQRRDEPKWPADPLLAMVMVSIDLQIRSTPLPGPPACSGRSFERGAQKSRVKPAE